jgi:hypothetical protein
VRLVLWVNGAFLVAFFVTAFILYIPFSFGLIPGPVVYFGAWIGGMVGSYFGYIRGNRKNIQ